MKPVYLEFCGINSFSQTAVIDFEKLLSGGVFGIFGDTGSGKSTILDAIHLALYGTVDRVSGAQTECINHRCEKAHVVYEFDIAYQGTRKRFRVQRERKKKTGGSKAYLYEKTGVDYLALAEGERDVNEKLGEIIGLTFEEFKKCIALPQGEFAGLVKMRPSDRLKLVADLFDLEKYGENLGRKVRAKYDLLTKEIEVLVGRLGENAEGSEENIAQKEGDLQAEKALLAAAEETLAEAKKALETLSRDYEEKLAYEALCRELAALEAKQAYYLALKQKLAIAPVAEGVVAKIKEIEKLRLDRQTALREGDDAEKTWQSAEREKTWAEGALREGAYDEKIWRIDEQLRLLKGAEEDIRLLKEAEAKCEDCRKRFKAIVDDTRDFVRLIAEAEAALSALENASSFEEYFASHFKGVLLEREYAEVRADLTALKEEYPVVTPAVDCLMDKYNPPKTQEEFRVEEAKTAYERLEKERRRLQELILKLKGDQAAQEARVQQRQAVLEEGQAYRAQVDAYKKRVEEALRLGDEKTLLAERKKLAEEKARLEKTLADATAKYTAAYAQRERQLGLVKAYETQIEEREKEVAGLLKEGGFAGVAEAETLCREIPDRQSATQKVQDFFGALSAKREQRNAFPQKDWALLTREVVEEARARQRACEVAREEKIRLISALESQLAALKEKRKKCEEMQAELKEKRKQLDLWEQLKSLVASNKFLDYIASEYLQEISLSASQTLLSLSGGKYFLTYEGEFKIGDNLNGGNLRAVRTLSGGETFLVSLSLALALSGAICQKSMRPIEFFFLDEGFGTLDEKLIDTVMNVLGKLIGNHFAIGLISHVEELKQRIENKVLVTGATETESSKVKVIAY